MTDTDLWTAVDIAERTLYELRRVRGNRYRPGALSDAISEIERLVELLDDAGSADTVRAMRRDQRRRGYPLLPIGGVRTRS